MTLKIVAAKPPSTCPVAMAVHRTGVDLGHFACLRTGCYCLTESGHLGERGPLKSSCR